MSKVSHKRRPAPHPKSAPPATVQRLIERGARRLSRAGVFFGHGTDNAWDEAANLVWHALALPEPTPKVYARRVTAAQAAAADAIIERRMRERIPAVYLTGQTWFAGLPFHTDPRALIPRSPIAELVESRFEPWVAPARVRAVLDIGTGGGCIAVACAVHLPQARVDAVDISPQALDLAELNVRRHGVEKRVRLLESDHFAALGGRRYDIIVSNPPYVGAREMRSLPAEYRHEPALALASGRDGMDSVRAILAGAAAHLKRKGVLIVEVGNTQGAVRRAFRKLPFTWLSFERGGGGVFLLTAEQLKQAGL